VFVLQGAQRSQRAHFCHAPGMQNINAIGLAERINHGGRTSRTPNDRSFEGAEIQTMGFHVAQQHLPNGGHTRCKSHLLSLDQFID